MKQICIDSKILIVIILVFGFKEGNKELMLTLLKLTWGCKFYAQVSFNKVNMSSLRLWPRYRGMRAGRLVQERSKLRRLKISTIQQRGVGNGLGKLSWRVSQQAHNPSNFVRLTSTSISTSLRKGSPSACVPSLYLSNVMSLAPKIDEIRYVAQHANLDCVMAS